MKKIIALLLVLCMMISLVACSENATNQTTEATTSEESTTEATTSEESTAEATTPEESTAEATTPEETRYAIGEAFGTDSVECVVTEVRWVTEEDVTSHPSAKSVSKSNGAGTYIYLDAKDMFPGYQFYGVSGFTSGYNKGVAWSAPKLCVTFTLKNVGKNTVEPAIKGYELDPYGNISVVYGDGYTFDSEEGFNTTLEVLGEEIKEGRIFDLPDQVSENEEEALMIRITLPDSSGTAEEFFVTVR